MTGSETSLQRPSPWRRWLARLMAFEQAASASHDETQDRRLARLEAEVRALRGVIAGEPASAAGVDREP